MGIRDDGPFLSGAVWEACGGQMLQKAAPLRPWALERAVWATWRESCALEEPGRRGCLQGPLLTTLTVCKLATATGLMAHARCYPSGNQGCICSCKAVN